MNIFFSWQADTPDAIGKSFIRSALEEAVSTLAESLNLDEAERPNIDQDTQGVLGSPAIAETIFEKIRGSQVVVVDVTLVGQTPNGKLLINSNVSYEQGYAHGHHGDHVLLAVMNTHYGEPDKLPFDLKHRRWPVRFNLAPDANKATRQNEKQSLAKELAQILKLYLEQHPDVKKNEPIPSSLNRASYWAEGEHLVNDSNPNTEDEEPVSLSFDKDQPLIYLRIWPDEHLSELSGFELNNQQVTVIEPLLGRTGGYSWTRNRHGMITYTGANAGQLFSATQVFKNREIWGLNAYALRHHDGYEFDFVPTMAFEQGIIRSLSIYLESAFNQLGYTKQAYVEGGLVNVNDYRLAMPANYLERYWGPIFEDIFVHGLIKKDDEESKTTFLLTFFEKLFDAAGSQRPENLYDFPSSA